LPIRRLHVGAFLVALALLAFASPQRASAQTLLDGGIIEEIRIEGSLRIDPQTVRSYMTVSPGDTFDPLTLNETLKRLYDTGFFEDVTLRRESDALVVVVAEHPTINRIAYEGNLRIDDETIGAETELRPARVFTRAKALSDAERIRDLYRRQGRFGATVEPKIIRQPQNRVDLVFEIDEGPKTTISAINFVGNRAFSDGELEDAIISQEYSYWNFLATTDSYDPDRLQFDEQLLTDFYRSEGYADFQVLSTTAELTPERDSFIITFVVEEGARYIFGTIDLESSLRGFDIESVRDIILTEEGDWYDASLVDDSIGNLTEAVGNQGYAFVDINPRVDKNTEDYIIGLTYVIEEGPKVYVERINIIGNDRTRDEVIRREFLLAEGDAFNASKLRRSRDRIQNLGFFSKVEIDSAVGSANDRSNVTLTVEEQSTGELSFGAGFSTSVGPIGSISIRERNLLGRGQDAQLSYLIAGERSELDFSFTEPYFLDRNLAAGFDLFRISQDLTDTSSFEEIRTGGNLRAGYQLAPNVRQLWRYTLQQREITDVQVGASQAVVQEQGTSIVSAVEQTLSYSQLDSIIKPTDGYRVAWTIEGAGLGGDVRFIKNSIEADYYYPLAPSWTIHVGGDVGNITGIGQDTRLSDRFFVGGGLFRGFESGGVGPRDAATGDALGGENFAVGTVELLFPVGLPEELGLSARVFSDFGSVWGHPYSFAVNDEASLRATAGVGLSWDSPFGPLVIDLGYPVLKEDFDEDELIYFSLGTRF
jgi:outer membrane protein insertion porin family